MSALAWAVVALPAAGAAGLALARGGRVAGAVAVGVAAATLAMSAGLAWRPGGGALLRIDAPAAHFGIVVALAGLLAAWFARVAHGGRGAAPVLGALAGLELAVLADAVALAWAGLLAAALLLVLGGARGLEARWRALRMVVPALGLALAGAVLLGQAGGGVPRWSAGAAPALMSLGWILLLAGLAALAGLAPLHGWAASVRGAAAALLPALAAAVLLVALRGREVVGGEASVLAPGPPLVALGVAGLGWAAVSLWREGARPAREAMLFQGGLAALAFGLGSQEGMAAGLLLLTVAAVLAPVAAWGGRGGAGALAGLALLPPFATFGAGLALLAAAVEAGGWLAAPLAGLVAAGAAGLARAAREAWRAAGALDRRLELPAALVLALAVAAGAAPAASRWFVRLTEGL